MTQPLDLMRKKAAAYAAERDKLAGNQTKLVALDARIADLKQ